MNIRIKNRKYARNGQKGWRGAVWYFKLKTISTSSKEVENVSVIRDHSSFF
jgi:hypothetical protein